MRPIHACDQGDYHTWVLVVIGQDGAEMVLGLCAGVEEPGECKELGNVQATRTGSVMHPGVRTSCASGIGWLHLAPAHGPREIKVSNKFCSKQIKEFVSELNQNYSLPLSPRPRTASRLSGTPFQESAMNFGDASSIFFFSSLYLKEITSLHYKSALNVKL